MLILILEIATRFNSFNHKNYNFLDCDWFKKLLFPTNSLVKLLSDSLLHHVIGQFVIGQFNKPITFKVVVKINQSHLSCSLNQPITTLASITIETSVQTPKLGLSLKWRIFFPLNNDYILEDSGDFFYPMAQMFMRTIQTSSSGDMLTCSDEVQPSTALFYIASQTTAAYGGKHPPD